MTTRLVYSPTVPVADMPETRQQAYNVTRAILARRLPDLQRLITTENVNDRIEKTFTPLMYAVHKVRQESVDYILSVGADVNILDQKSRNVYHVAAEGGHNDILQSILTAVVGRGEEPILDAFDTYGTTPLMLAAKRGHEDVIQTLLNHGANVHVKHPEKASTALHMAASKGHFEAVQRLLAHPDPPFLNEVDAHGATPLISACRDSNVNRLQIVQSIYGCNSHGIPPDCNLRDAEGWTCFMYAMYRGEDKTMEFLLLQTPEPNLWMCAPPGLDQEEEQTILELTPLRYRKMESYGKVTESLRVMVISTFTDSIELDLLEEIARVVAIFTYG